MGGRSRRRGRDSRRKRRKEEGAWGAPPAGGRGGERAHSRSRSQCGISAAGSVVSSPLWPCGVTSLTRVPVSDVQVLGAGRDDKEHGGVGSKGVVS